VAKADSGIPLSEWSGSGATRELHETIRAEAERADERARQVLFWARVAGVAAIVSAVLAVLAILVA
jgi:hypothetical protein